MLRKRLGFLFLVAFFTVFGAGRSHYWNPVAVDQAGWTYAVDLYSLRLESPQVLSCQMLTVHRGGGRLVDRWTLDAEHYQLRRRSRGDVETILPGSIAERVIVFLRQNGHMPLPLGLPMGSR